MISFSFAVHPIFVIYSLFILYCFCKEIRTLQFYSCYNEQLVRVGRSMFSHLAFGTSAPKAKVDDHNKPLYVVCGMDTFEVSCQHATY